MMKKWILGIFAGILVTAIVVAIILIVPMGDKFEPKLELETSDMEIYIDNAPQKLTYIIECNEQYSVEFIASNDVVSVDKDGYVTANIVGNCVVEIKVSSISLTKSVNISVVVKEREIAFVPNLELTAIDNISLYNDDAPKQIQYFISCNEKYSVEFEASSDIVGVDSYGVITPNKVGTCSVFVKASSASQLQQNKEITVTINKSEITASLEIKDNDGTIPPNIFTAKEYILEITCTKKLIYSPMLKTSSNISNLTLKEKQEQKILYTFKVINHGETSFNFLYKDYTNTFTKQSYMYVSKIDINFARKIENMQILLHLFNKNYENTANESNFYQNIKFCILNQLNVINNYSVQLFGDNATLEYSSNTYTLLAKTAGESQLKIYANDGSGYFVTYSITVQEIHISSIGFTQQNVALDTYEEYGYKVNFSPEFALTDLTYFLNDEPYTNTTLQFSNAGSNILKVKDTLSNLEATLTITVTQKENPFTIMWNTSFMKTHVTSFEDDTLSVTTNEDIVEIPFSYRIQGVTNIECDMSYTLNDITLKESAHDDNIITLTLQGKGSIMLILTSKENPLLSYTLTIVVLWDKHINRIVH